MSTPDKNTVNAGALAAQIALKDAANLAFITAADIVIAEVEAQGRFRVHLPVLKPASLLDISTHYRDLGYGVTYRDCSSWNTAQWPGPWSYPFGPFYSLYHICNCKAQCKVEISWK